MLRRMQPEQLRDWQIYAELEPFGEEREDLRTAYIATLLYNIHRDSKQSPSPAKTLDVYGHFLKEVKGLQALYEQSRGQTEQLSPEDEEARRQQIRSGRTQTWQEQKAIMLSWAFRVAAERKKARVVQGTKKLGDNPGQAND